MSRTAELFRRAAVAEGRGWRLALAAAGFGGHQFAEVLVPVAVGVVIDRAIQPHDGAALGWSLAFLAATFVLLIASWQAGDRLITRVYARGEHDLRQQAVSQVLRSTGPRRAPGQVLTLATADTAQVAGIAWVVVEQVGAVAALIVAGVVLIGISWPLAVAVLLCVLLQGLLVHLLSGRLRRRSYTAQRRAADLDTLGADFATGQRPLEALGATDAAAHRYRRESGLAAEAAYREDRAEAALSAVNAVVAGLVFAGLAALAGGFAVNGLISVGAFITAVAVAQTIRGPLQILGYLPGDLAAKHGSATRLTELLDDPTELAAESPARLFTGLAIRLPERTVTIAPGELVGLSAGSAGVDLVNLLGTRRAPAPGELLINGADATKLPPHNVRELIFAAPHDAALFSGTIRSSLGAASTQELAASGFDEVVARLGGLDEQLGENGSRLSGGQRQRLLLARALATTAPLLVLHEPTTAVDPVTEAHIAGQLGPLLRRTGRTLLLVSDRPALLTLCDRVEMLSAVSP